MPLGLVAAIATGGWAGGAGADEDFVVGSGRARASLFEILPRTGGLTIPVNFGRAVASYQGTVARASSLVVKPPSEPPAAPAAECGDQSPEPPSGGGGGGGGSSPSFSFPFASNLEVSSDQKDSEKGKKAAFAASPSGSPVEGVMQQQSVAARRDPRGEAKTTSGRLALAGVAELVGGRAEARSGIVDGRARLAHAVVVMQELNLFDGAVRLEDLRWEATQRTGEGEMLDGGFSLGRVVLAGTPLPAPAGEGGDPLAALNEALAPSGIAFEAPRLDKSGGVARVTPLTLRMADSPLGREYVGPALGGLQPVRDPLVNGLLAFSCDFGLAVTVADIALGVASGSGAVSFDFGGALATTEGTRYENPFGGPLDDVFPVLDPPIEAPLPPDAPLLDSGAAPAFEPPAPGPTFPPDRGFLPDTAADGGAPLPAGDELVAFQPASPAALPSPSPASSHLPGRRGGTALAVGIIGLAGILALALADALHIRRSARTIP